MYVSGLLFLVMLGLHVVGSKTRESAAQAFVLCSRVKQTHCFTYARILKKTFHFPNALHRLQIIGLNNVERFPYIVGESRIKRERINLTPVSYINAIYLALKIVLLIIITFYSNHNKYVKKSI